MFAKIRELIAGGESKWSELVEVLQGMNPDTDDVDVAVQYIRDHTSEWDVRPKTLASAIELFDGRAALKHIYLLGFEPGKEQRALIAHTLRQVTQYRNPDFHGQKLCLFPGAAGTGKSTCLELFLRVLKDCKLSTTIAAPTWKAAKRAEECIGEKVFTVHSVVYAGAKEDEETDEDGKPLEFSSELLFKKQDDGSASVGDIVVIDEASMVGMETATDMWRALPSRCVVVAVGDHHQLPPVRDLPGFPLIEAKVKLEQVYRQKKASPVLVAATKIRQEEVPFTWSKIANWQRGGAILKSAGITSTWRAVKGAAGEFKKMWKRTNGDAICIVGVHTSRVAFNDAFREQLKLGPRENGPAVGEQLICRRGRAGLTTSEIVHVVSVSPQNFGDRFGDGWFVKVKRDDGKEMEIALLRSMWVNAPQGISGWKPTYRGLIPRSVSMEMERYLADDEEAYGEAIQARVSAKKEKYSDKHGKECPTWLSEIWKAEVARDLGAWALYLNAFMGCVDTGYAITCHSAQGSQYKEIMIVADSTDFLADDGATVKNIYKWSYTALTRAIEDAVVVCKSRDGGWYPNF